VDAIWLAGDPAAGRRADLVACELATGGWAFALPWLLDTATRFPGRLAPLVA
jgi:hypothetical protein